MIPSKYCDPSSSKRALEICELDNMPTTPPMGGRRHLSKSTSELSSPREMPEHRPRSAAPPETSHLSVYQKAHSFFAQLKSRLGHSKRERRHKSPGRQDSTDYAADLSSDHSTPSSTQSPRHRIYTRTDSPLSRACGGDTTSSPGGSPRPRAPTPGAVAGLDLLPLTSTDEITRRREAALRQHSFFQLRIHLRRGHGLVAMDKNGLSDPYVKFKCGGRLVYKSRTVYRDLNPVWDESFTVPIEDPFLPISIKVFDYDWGLQDDFMGAATLDLSSLDLSRAHDIALALQDPSRPDASLGEILLNIILYPKTQEDKEQEAELWCDTIWSEHWSALRCVFTLMLPDRTCLFYYFDPSWKFHTPPLDPLRKRFQSQRQNPPTVHRFLVFKSGTEPIVKMDYTATSRIRRSVKTNLSRFRHKLQRQVSRSLNDLSAIEESYPILPNKLTLTELTSSTLSISNAAENEGEPFTNSKIRTFEIMSSTDDSGEDPSDSQRVKYKVVLDEAEDASLLERIGMKLREQSDKVHMYFQKNSRIQDVNKRLKSQIWSSVVTIVLVEGKNLLACDPETGTSDPYVRFRLGNEKYKSRVIWRSLNPRWLEQLDLHLYDDGDQQLEITVWDKDRSRDDFMGRCAINLMSFEREKTHNIWQELEDGAGSLHLLLTISGTTASETISDLTTYEENPRERQVIEDRYVWHRTFHNLKDVGHLTVKVFKATGLAAADLGGKSDPFCVVELGNARLQTQTEYKTLTPSWNKIFTFNVKDINSVLEITVFDEDRDHKVEFLGKVAIPLLRIRNGEKRWYALKDKKLRSRAKGSNPQILLEMVLEWNPIRACIRTLNPKEEKYMQTEVKFKRQVFVKNVLRLKAFIIYFYEIGKLLQNCFEWESKLQSFGALVVWLILCYYFEPWMLPVALLLIFLKQYIIRTLAGPTPVPWDETADSDLDDDDEEEKEKEEKKSLKERLQAIQEVTQGVQNAIGKIASLLESIKNTFNFTVPYLSWIAIVILILAAIVLYILPVRYLLMLWGTNKFFRRILRPHAVVNNELYDLLSRIPDDEMLLDYKDLKLLISNETDRRRDPKKKHKTS